MNTFERLVAKSRISSKERMPSIKAISELLTENGIEHSVDTKTHTVEYRSKGNRYVNSRHQGKTGYVLTIQDHYIELDTTDSYYSWNNSLYAGKLVKLIESKQLNNHLLLR